MGGRTGNPIGRPPVPPERRFWSKLLVDKSTECWEWLGSTRRDGYMTRFRLGGTGSDLIYPHRYAYEVIRGPIPTGLMIDHLCRNRACVNPFHMEPVTNRENLRRGHQARGTARGY